MPPPMLIMATLSGLFVAPLREPLLALAEDDDDEEDVALLLHPPFFELLPLLMLVPVWCCAVGLT
jgi:hypothetical protein